MFSTTEPFLILFFLFYVAIGLLFASRQPLKHKGYIDCSMVFGTPIICFAFQSRLVEPYEYGLAWSALGLTYEALGNIRLAEDAYDNAVRVAPRDYKIQENYAVFLCRQDRFDDARMYFDKAIKAPTNDYAEQTYTNAGVCMMQKPDHVAAEAYLRAALERRPNYGEALLQMSVLSYETGDALRARAFLQRYLDSNMPTAPVLMHGIRIEEKLGDDTARREYTMRLLRDFPDSAEAERIRQAG